MKRNSDIDGVYKQLLILCEQGLINNGDAYVNVANGMVVENPAAKLGSDAHTIEKEVERIRNQIAAQIECNNGYVVFRSNLKHKKMRNSLRPAWVRL